MWRKWLNFVTDVMWRMREKKDSGMTHTFLAWVTRWWWQKKVDEGDTFCLGRVEFRVPASHPRYTRHFGKCTWSSEPRAGLGPVENLHVPLDSIFPFLYLLFLCIIHNCVIITIFYPFYIHLPSCKESFKKLWFLSAWSLLYPSN